MKRNVIVLLLILISMYSTAQRMRTICGECIYPAPSNVSEDEAKKTAIFRAKIQALANEFGTDLSQNNATVVKNDNGQSTIDFKSFSGSEVKGEWIEDTKEPEILVSYEQGMLIVKARVCGKAREIIRASISFSAKLLRNGKEDRHEDSNFKSSDDLYLSFQSPVNGYLTVYLIDDDQNVFCLLPYARDNDGQVEIKHGLRYLFFDFKSAPDIDKPTVDELSITCSKAIEHNQIYIIFSPNKFIKANDNQKTEGLPRELSYSDFQRWIIKNRNIDKEMQVSVKNIVITK